MLDAQKFIEIWSPDLIAEADELQRNPKGWNPDLHRVRLQIIPYANHGAGIFTNIYPINHPVL